MTHFHKIESPLSISHGCDENETELSQFFNKISAQTPPDQKDTYFEFLMTRFDKANIPHFVHHANPYTTTFVAKDDKGLVGVLFAELAHAAALEEEGWLDAKDHMRVLWYGVREDARDVRYNEPEYEISKLLLSFLVRDLPEFNCNRMEALVHNNNLFTAQDLLDSDFEYRGAISNNVQPGVISAAASGLKYERYVYQR